MKKSLFLLGLLILVLVATATKFSDNRLDGHLKAKCIAIHPFDLKADVDVAEFEIFLNEKILSLYNKVEGQEAILLKGDRGQRTGKYAVMLTFDDVAKRNEVYPPEGGISEEFQKVSEGTDADWEKISDYVVGNFWDNHTDYFVVE